MKKMTLVYPPNTRLIMPFGIALLKGYIEKNSDVKVRCLDLNAEMHNDLQSGINDGSLGGDIGMRGLLLGSMMFFRGENNKGFYDQRYYSQQANYWLNGVESSARNFMREYDACVERNVLKICEGNPEIVGFSCMFDGQVAPALRLAELLRGFRPEIGIVFGGRSATEGMECFDFIDDVICGEGENELLRMAGGTPNAEPAFVDFSDFDMGAYMNPGPVIPILTSRGCYWRRCAFCVHHQAYGGYRETPVKQVVDEIEHHAKAGIRYFSFVDEMISASRLWEIGLAIQRRGLEINYYVMAKPTSDFTSKVLRTAVDSGCKYIIWGVESGCQRVLAWMDKGTTPFVIGRVLRLAGVAGIRNHIFIMAGFPTETEAEFRETLKFIDDNRDDIHTVHKSVFALRKGSIVYNNPKKFGITNIREAAGKYEYEVSTGMSYEEAKKVKNYYHEQFIQHANYFSPFSALLRDHALFHYANEGLLKFNVNRPKMPKIDDVPYFEA